MNVLRFALSICVVTFLSPLATADDSSFYTIIGPDGRPMVVPTEKKQSDQSKQTSSKAKQQEAATQQEKAKLIKPQATKVAEQNKAVEQSNRAEQKTIKTADKMPTTTANKDKAATPTTNTIDQAEQAVTQQEKVKSTPQQPLKPTKTDSQPKKINAPMEGGLAKTSSIVTADSTPNENAEKQKSQFIDRLDGEEYINSEYLEQKQFNLEGKKRFYTIPDSGDLLSQTVEREKGLNISSFQLPTVASSKAVTLSSNYKVIPSEAVANAIGQACFDVDTLDDAKKLSAKKRLNLWPRSSFKSNNVDFELITLDHTIQDIEIQSYADSAKSNAFYWPMVISLDAKGCVIEAVSSYYVDKNEATRFQKKNIYGNVHLHDQTKYLALTPLQEAVDLSGLQLVDQGQLRLNVLR